MQREQKAGMAVLLAISAALIVCIIFAGPKRAETPAFALKNGVRASVLPVEANEVMDVLEWKRWKFHIAVPTTNGLQTDVELWRSGKYAQTLGGGGCGGGYGGPSNREFDVTVYMRPEYGDWIKDARIITRVQFGVGSAITTRTSNPYRNIQQIGVSFPNGLVREGLPDDGLSLGMIFYQPLGAPLKGGPPRDTDSSFSLILRMRPQTFPQDAPVPAKPNSWQSVFAERTHAVTTAKR